MGNPPRFSGPVVLLYDKQLEFKEATEAFVGFVGGIGTGKSFILCYNRVLKCRTGGVYMMIAPTFPMLRDATLRSFVDVARRLGVPFQLHKSEMVARFPTSGAEVLFRSGDNPEGLRGPNLTGVDLDEASLMAEEVFDISIGRLRKDGKFGELRAAFTPKGIYHWTYERFAKRNKDGELAPNTRLIHARTEDNWFLPEDYVGKLKEQYSPMFARQELGGEFLEIDGAEWPSAWFPESHWFDAWPDPTEFTLRVVAVDSSMGKRADKGDYSAIVFIGRTKDGTLWVECDMERRPITKVVSDGIADAKRWQRETGGILDGFGVESDVFQALVADEFARQSKAAGIMLPIYEVLTGGVDKVVRMRRLTPYLSRGNFRWRNTPGTQMLLRQSREFPVGDHDDGVDATEMALRLAIDISHEKAA